MADEADIANEYIMKAFLHLDDRKDNAKPPSMGSKTCHECGELIPVERRQLGFDLCIECASETERRKSLFAD